jgi:hypothetical protein
MKQLTLTLKPKSKLDRRCFLKLTGTAAAITVIPSSLLLSGCNSESIVQGLNIVLQSAEGILNVLAPGDPWAADFQQAVAALQQAEAAWQGGGAINIIVSALNTLEAVTAVVPFTAPYSALIDILVAGIESVLLLIQNQNPSVSVAAAATAHPNPHEGKYHLGRPHAFQTPVGVYRKAWNDAVKANPVLAAAKLQ